MDQHDALLREIREFLEQTGMAPTTFGLAAVNDGKFVARIEAGGGLTLRTVERVREFIAARKVSA